VSRQPKSAASAMVVGIALLISPQIQAAPQHATLNQRTSHSTTSAAGRRAVRPTHHPMGRSSAVFPADVESSPAFRYAQHDAESCYAEIQSRQLPVRREDKHWPSIMLPMRLTGPVNGVVFRTDILESERGVSPYELFDCRLVLGLDDFSKLLRTEAINEVVLSSAYRPPPKGGAGDETAKRHAAGLAVDIHRFRRQDGRWIVVEKEFHGRIGMAVCRKAGVSPATTTPEAALLRRIVCGAAEQRLFQCILTPNYDHAHRNHLHLELTVGVRWFIVS
jgi:hypothetical protein